MFIVSGWTVVELPYVAFDKEASKPAARGALPLLQPDVAYTSPGIKAPSQVIATACLALIVPVILGSPASRLPFRKEY